MFSPNIEKQLKFVNSKIAYWKEEGYTDKVIEKLRDALAMITIKDKSTWHKDKKEARKVFKELREKLYKRKS